MKRVLRILFALAISPAAAQQQNLVPFQSGTTSAVTVTSTSAQIAPASNNRQLVAIDNESTTATIACNFGGTAVINSAGSFTFPPQTTRVWNSMPIPTDAINCISSAATSPATLEIR